MQRCVGVGLLAVGFLVAIPVGAALAQSNEEVLKRLDALEKENAALRGRVKRLEAVAHKKDPTATATASTSTASPRAEEAAVKTDTVVTEAAMKPTAGYYPPPPVVRQPALYNWTGLYVGAHAGGEQARSEGSTHIGTALSSLQADLQTRQSLDGFLGGGQLGYNYQFGHTVVGAELSGSWMNANGRGNLLYRRRSIHSIS